MKIRPIIHHNIHEVLAQPQFLLDAKQLHGGPVHIIFPVVMDENIHRLRASLANEDIESVIQYAHKPNKSLVFVKQALKNGIGIDVASRQELVSALAAGYTGDKISCTGAKNEQFCYLAVQHGALISIDSLEELQQIIAIKSRLQKDTVRILLRIADPVLSDRRLKTRLSRFGIARDDLISAYKSIARSGLTLVGFHFHNDERSADVKAGFVECMLDCFEQAYAAGFAPTIIDIGGGLRTRQLEDFQEWANYLSNLEQKLLTQQSTDTWRGYGYGMYVNERGKIAGLEKIQGKFFDKDYSEVHHELLDARAMNGRKIGDTIRESMLKVMLEPGFALLQNCGISLVSVIGTKMTHTGDNLIMLDANIYNLSTQMNELMTDPLLVGESSEDDSYSGYLMGNLCREEDVLMKRKVSFPRRVKVGDVLCFVNTAAYTSDFEDAQPHQHITGKKFVMVKIDGQWKLAGEDVYSPYVSDRGETE